MHSPGSHHWGGGEEGAFFLTCLTCCVGPGGKRSPAEPSSEYVEEKQDYIPFVLMIDHQGACPVGTLAIVVIVSECDPFFSQHMLEVEGRIPDLNFRSLPTRLLLLHLISLSITTNSQPSSSHPSVVQDCKRTGCKPYSLSGPVYTSNRNPC